MSLTAQSPLVDGQAAVSAQSVRIASIDILRALTMVLMIFVNDLWSLTNIPLWLLHTTATQDGMGLSDVIFPAFLFIVGMSIPFAINNRRKKGDSNGRIVLHILVRAAALLIMGLFLVNGENLNAAATGIPRLLYFTLCCASFILVWNAYPAAAKPAFVWAARAAGIITLLVLAFMMRGGEQVVGFKTYWWGILGLIGWSYLVCSLIYTFLGSSLTAVIASWILMLCLSMASNAGMISFGLLSFIMDPLSNGSLPFLTMGGIVISLLYLHFKKQHAKLRMLALFAGIAALLLAAGFYTNRFWIIAKLGATPPWILLCSGITILAFMLIYRLADMNGKAHWFNPIKPAGTNTLLCYLIPYFSYAAVSFTGIHWPAFMLNGAVGLLKSFLFALLCVFIAGWLGKRGVQLKL
jgi:heparan-alpha-glucosaminide N-acetyltransferase